MEKPGQTSDACNIKSITVIDHLANGRAFPNRFGRYDERVRERFFFSTRYAHRVCKYNRAKIVSKMSPHILQGGRPRLSLYIYQMERFFRGVERIGPIDTHRRRSLCVCVCVYMDGIDWGIF